ncbi:MAG: hypothetical protein FWG52_09335, partial [Proteobacteria bacterium]|nr:hypothetical protein [Pseudomonadota bacterium]
AFGCPAREARGVEHVVRTLGETFLSINSISYKAIFSLPHKEPHKVFSVVSLPKLYRRMASLCL